MNLFLTCSPEPLLNLCVLTPVYSLFYNFSPPFCSSICLQLLSLMQPTSSLLTRSLFMEFFKLSFQNGWWETYKGEFSKELLGFYWGQFFLYILNTRPHYKKDIFKTFLINNFSFFVPGPHGRLERFYSFSQNPHSIQQQNQLALSPTDPKSNDFSCLPYFLTNLNHKQFLPGWTEASSPHSSLRDPLKTCYLMLLPCSKAFGSTKSLSK